MNIKKLTANFIAIAIAFSLCARADSNAKLSVLDSTGKIIAEFNSLSKFEKEEKNAYVQIAVDEAVKIITEKENLSEKSAKKQLFKGGYTIYTACDSVVNSALNESCDNLDQKINIGSAITDLNGNLIAAYSTNSKDALNFSTNPTDPCSAFKPLSVYTPAIENGVINWSSRYEDSPYKQVKEENGSYRDWPKNASGVYTKKYAYPFQAVKESINTVAVKCLNDVGVNQSIQFLETKLGISLADEKYTASVYGEDEVIGNIALGSLSQGVSPVDMAGYYQMFANGGFYSAPKAVLKIADIDSNIIYTREKTTTQVIKTDTSELMNRMLREVVAPGGTGENIDCADIEVAGKTGTDESGGNNWFVGITPQYSCSVWHSLNTKNTAPEIFSNIVNNIYKNNPSAVKRFTYKSGLSTVAYCTETGKMAKAGCTLIRLGYFTRNNVPSLCDRH